MSIGTPPPQRLEGPVVALGRSRSTSRTLGRSGPASAAVEGRYARARRYGAPWHRKRWRSYSMGHVLEHKKTHINGPSRASDKFKHHQTSTVAALSHFIKRIQIQRKWTSHMGQLWKLTMVPRCPK